MRICQQVIDSLIEVINAPGQTTRWVGKNTLTYPSDFDTIVVLLKQNNEDAVDHEWISSFVISLNSWQGEEDVN